MTYDETDDDALLLFHLPSFLPCSKSSKTGQGHKVGAEAGKSNGIFVTKKYLKAGTGNCKNLEASK